MKEVKDLTILVVDDEPDLGELVAFEFELVGANVLNAGNGLEAFDKIKKNSIDAVVSDIRMPGGDGVELLDNLKTHDKKRPILIFMTGFADITLEDAYDKGAAAMFGKPFNRKELLSSVGRNILEPAQRWQNQLSQKSYELSIEQNFSSFAEAIRSPKVSFGQGGLFLVLDNKIPQTSEIVHFKLNFSQEKFSSIEGEGIVRWIRRQDNGDLKKGVGIEIHSILGDGRDYFCQYIEVLDTKKFIPKG